jgi:hypothetical protein
MTKRQCACQRVGSPIKGVVWTPEGREVQRCDPCAYEPEPPFALFLSDEAAAMAMQSAGYTITVDHTGGFIAEAPAAPAKKPTRIKVTDEDLQAARLEVARTHEPYDEALKARQQLVRRALKQGMTPAHIARLVGLSREMVGRLH